MTAVDPRSFLPACRFEPTLPLDTQALVFVDTAGLRAAAQASIEGVSFFEVCETLSSFAGISLILLDEGKNEKTLPQLKALWPEHLAERIGGAAPEWGELLTAANHGAWGEVRAFLLENHLMGAPMLCLDARLALYPASTHKWILAWDEFLGLTRDDLAELEKRLLALGLEKNGIEA